MGPGEEAQAALFYGLSREGHVPQGHLRRSIDGCVDLGGYPRAFFGFCSRTGRPSVGSKLRMLLVGCCFGIRSERRLCEGVHLRLAYRWFCRLGLNGQVPGEATFPRTALGVSAPATCAATGSGRRWRGASPQVSSAARAWPLMPA